MKLYQNTCGAKSTNTGAASQLWAGLPGFQLQLLDSCHQHEVFNRGKPQEFLGVMFKVTMLKLELKTSGIKDFKCPVLSDDNFWSILGAEHTRQVTDDQKSNCHACIHQDINKKLPRGTNLLCTRTNNTDIVQPSR